MKKAFAIAVLLMPGKRLAVEVLLLKLAKRKNPLWFDGEVVLAEIMAYADEIATRMEAEHVLLRAA